MPDHKAVLARIKRDKLTDYYKKIRIIPMMYLAGRHVEDDLMGEENSWKCALEKLGFTVECPTISIEGESCFKGLAYYPEVTEGFLSRLQRTMELEKVY